MKYSKNLEFAEKYNWWTKETGKISKETKISYIMSKGNLYELFYVFKTFNNDILEKSYNLIKNDNFILKEKRKNVIKVFFEEKLLKII